MFLTAKGPKLHNNPAKKTRRKPLKYKDEESSNFDDFIS